jgi:hypothetical protein
VGAVPGWNEWVDTSAVGRRRGVGACDTGIVENGNALGVVREDKVDAYLVVVEVVVWQLGNLRCAVYCWCWLKRSLTAVRVWWAKVCACAFRSWVDTARCATASAVTIPGAILTRKSQRDRGEIVRNSVAGEKLFQASVLLGDSVAFLCRRREHFL